MKILFVGGEKDGEHIDVSLDDDGYPFYYWQVDINKGEVFKSILYKVKAVRWSHGGLKHWEYHLV